MKELNENKPILLTEVTYEKEMTLRDIVLMVTEYIHEIKKNIKIFPFFVIPLCIYFLVDAIMTDDTYTSKVTFLVTNDSEKGGMGDIASILGSLGMGNIGGKSDESALEKVLQLFKSRQIIENALFQKVTINGNNDFLANHMLRSYRWEKLLRPYKILYFISTGWVKDLENTKDFAFTNGNIDKFSRTESLVLKVLYERIVGSSDIGLGATVGSTIDEKSGIMSITMTSLSEDLTSNMLMLLYTQLSDYYINKTIEKQKKIFEIAKFKKDSLAGELGYADRSLAEFEDGNRNLVWVRGELKRTNMQRRTRILEGLYSQSITQTETADFALRNKTPYVQIIDKPARPILPYRVSKSRTLLMAIFIGCALATVFILFRKFLRQAMADF
jgi:hypothetical protein